MREGGYEGGREGRNVLIPTDILSGSFWPVIVTISDGSDKTCYHDGMTL